MTFCRRIRRPVIIGLTGSIGMGKSTAATMLRRAGIRVFDADRAVHRMMATGGEAVPALAAAFSACARTDADTGNISIDRACLSKHVANNPDDLKQLEIILHPLVRQAQQRARRDAACAKAPELVLDIPLLFETGGDQRCDLVIVVTAPVFLQRQRVMARPGMTQQKFKLLLGKQIPDKTKRCRADLVIQTGIGRKPTRTMLFQAIRDLRRSLFVHNNRPAKPSHPPLFVPENPHRWTPHIRGS
jgi:dephospho-CoA kinase